VKTHLETADGRQVKTLVRTKFGTLVASLSTRDSGEQCLVFRTEAISGSTPTIRIHSACLFGEALYSRECECRQQLDASLAEICLRNGVLVYLFQEGRGIGLRDKIRAMDIEETGGMSTVQAFAHLGFQPDLRRYDIAVQALQREGVGKEIRLITNNPQKIAALSNAGFVIVERVEPRLTLSAYAYKMLKSKQEALQHIPYRNVDIAES
jgi:GTP cyclohydrolase II